MTLTFITFHLGYKNQSVTAAREIIAVCSQTHTKHINTVCVGRT